MQGFLKIRQRQDYVKDEMRVTRKEWHQSNLWQWLLNKQSYILPKVEYVSRLCIEHGSAVTVHSYD